MYKVGPIVVGGLQLPASDLNKEMFKMPELQVRATDPHLSGQAKSAHP